MIRFLDFKQYIVKIYIKMGVLKTHARPQRDIHDIHLFYRICDFGYPKQKPDYITKENCLRNAVGAFPLDSVKWHVLADNVCEETYKMVLKYIPKDMITRVNVGHGAGTFRMAYNQAVLLNDDDLVYFLEDDYLHLPQSLDILKEAAKCNNQDYVTLYDHPDKYSFFGAGNSLIGQKLAVYYTGHRHWRITSSTTMTFAAFADTLKRDKDVFMRWTRTRHPYDFQIFVELFLFKKAYLISPIPSLSTHGETLFLAPGIDWNKM